MREWARTAAQAADSKKASDPVILDLANLLTITDAFVIVSGANDRQVKAIAEEIEQQVKDSGGPSPIRVEGLDEARWVLIDYSDFVVHVFLEEVRDFYNLERLWGDAPRIKWDTTASAVNE